MAKHVRGHRKPYFFFYCHVCHRRAKKARHIQGRPFYCTSNLLLDLYIQQNGLGTKNKDKGTPLSLHSLLKGLPRKKRNVGQSKAMLKHQYGATAC